LPLITDSQGTTLVAYPNFQTVSIYAKYMNKDRSLKICPGPPLCSYQLGDARDLARTFMGVHDLRADLHPVLRDVLRDALGRSLGERWGSRHRRHHHHRRCQQNR
jgi:hypothetical protein